jgi:inner membrane protein
MDTLTHALSGALIARAVAPAQTRPAAPTTRQLVMAGTVAALFPDTDILTTLLSPLTYLTLHRGVTHSFLLLPVWAVLLALLMALTTRKLPAWRDYVLVCGLGVGIHILGDWITSFGTMFLAPLSDARFALGTTFIVDLAFTGIILAGLFASLLWRKSRIPATAALTVLCGYVGMQAWLRQQAIEFGERYAEANGLIGAQVDALPRPPLPGNWTVVVSAGEEYRFAHINLWRDSVPNAAPDAGLIARIHASFAPPANATWEATARFGLSEADRALALEAWGQGQFGFYRWFAELPALYRIDRGNPSTCVWFQDLRFLTPGRVASPFRYGLCREAGGPWGLFKLTGAGSPAPLW